MVTGGDDVEQRRFGDHLSKPDRYRRAGEFLHVVRALWSGEAVEASPASSSDVRGAQIIPASVWPDIYR